MLLCQQKFSTDYTALLETLAHTDNLLLIQDLDGVCMPLVNDPLTRRLSPDYLRAAHALTPEFYVLTNGEHIGRRGINHLVDKALQQSGHGQYLPGLAAGGVQWQDHFGSVNHPGVSQAGLGFL
ncbi:MAG TPA: glucosylglycerolphosphate phosphatase, partial [Gammaproteobacteria bacterium]|nr:glucosylglycerolphosphate phosphatase [Gammaproteobacteria bacterium]